MDVETKNLGCVGTLLLAAGVIPVEVFAGFRITLGQGAGVRSIEPPTVVRGRASKKICISVCQLRV